MPSQPRRNRERRDVDRRLAWWLAWLYPPRFRRGVGLALVDAI